MVNASAFVATLLSFQTQVLWWHIVSMGEHCELQWQEDTVLFLIPGLTGLGS